MIDINKLSKFYYTISDVAEMFSLNESTLRYWESEFYQLKPKKNRKGDRRYKKEDILTVEKIFKLVKEKGFTLKGAKIELKQKIKESKENDKIIMKLKKIKKELGLIKIKLSSYSFF